MILKASQRGGAKQLGLHLMRTDENEHVELHEVRGFVSQDVVGALKEAYAVSRGTKAKQFLFSVSLNPPQNESVPIETFENAIERIEERNGLTGQPRVIIFHEKEGRRHCHAVWSRTDPDTMTARPLPFYKEKLRDISRDLYLENGWKMPRGLMSSREADPRSFTLAEWQQAKRAGQNPCDLKQAIHECWAVSDSSQSFARALEERGLRLAKGDRRSHVAVTTQGQVFAIARSIGKKAKDVRARLGEPDTLQSVDDTKAQIAKDLTPTVQRAMQEAEANAQRQMTLLSQKSRDMATHHKDERHKLDTAQKDRWDRETKERSDRLNKGIRGLWQRMTGEHARTIKRNQFEALEALRRDRAQREAQIFAQGAERRKLQEQIHTARAVHTKEMTDLHRDLARLKHGELPEPVKRAPMREPEKPLHAPELQKTWERHTGSTIAKAEQSPSHQDRLDRLKNPNRSPRARDRGPTHER